MKPKLLGACCLLMFFCISASAQNNFFSDAAEAGFSKAAQRVIIPAKYRTLSLNKTGLQNFFKTVPAEKLTRQNGAAAIIELPMPDGGTAKFKIWESSVMAPELAAKFPDIKTFTGQGIDDPTANIKIDWTEFGFHAMVLSSLKGSVFIDPYSRGNTNNYIAYNKTDFKKALPYRELPSVKNKTKIPGNAAARITADNCIGTELRTYRLALAADGEYTKFQGGTVSAAQAAMATSMNRVNGVYERELDIRMVLVANNNLLIYTDTASDPYTNGNPNYVMLEENQNNIDNVIGNANYDIGHVFSTGGGGVAGLGVVCITGQKANGVTGTSSPVGDPYDIDYVAHEMGHEFGASHSFNSVLDACNGTGDASTNAEPGSGITIMAYAGICGSDNLAIHSDAKFHPVSYDEITAYSINSSGNSCALITPTNNNPPTVNAGADYVIPKSTPFSLTGSATDPDGDALTYSWDEVDVGGPFGSWDNPSGNAPIFRSFLPISTPTRYFPQLSDLVTNTTTIGELLPSYARTLHFRLTARDNKAGGGGVCYDEAAVTVAGNAGPFVLTSPNTSGLIWYVNEFKTITWNVAGTNNAPVACANVKIELSTDGGLSYSVTLIASTPNDGSEEIQVPNNVSSKARIRVTAVGNIFYDVCNYNIAIQAPTSPSFVFNNPVNAVGCGGVATVASVLKTASLSNFSTAITLTASTVPSGTTVSYSANPVAPGSNTTVTLNNFSSLANGSYPVTITGVAGSVTKSVVINFVKSVAAAAPATLSQPVNNANGVALLPSFNWSAVSGADSYKLEISTSNVFSTITQSISNITLLPYTLLTPLAENTVYYWRVSAVNSCGAGAVSATNLFKTGISPCVNSTNVPVTISSTAVSTVTSTLTIPANAGLTISDLNVVGLNISHTYINDLVVTLKSPAGTSVVLFSSICSDEDNIDMNLDDQSTTTTYPCPPIGGVTVKPQNALSAFNGQSSAGVWTLTVRDNYEGDGGSINGWGLTINNCPAITTPINNSPAYAQLCAPAASTSLTSNLTGTAYQWQVNTGSGFVNITNNTNYSGATTQVLQITNAPSSWNNYQYRAVVDGANSNTFVLGFRNYWTGAVSNAWETAGNWSCNSVPDINTDVYVNGGTVKVSSAANCRTLNVTPGANVTVNTGFSLKVVH